MLRCPYKCPRGKSPLPLPSIKVKLRAGGQFSSEAIFLEPHNCCKSLNFASFKFKSVSILNLINLIFLDGKKKNGLQSKIFCLYDMKNEGYKEKIGKRTHNTYIRVKLQYIY